MFGNCSYIQDWFRRTDSKTSLLYHSSLFFSFRKKHNPINFSRSYLLEAGNSSLRQRNSLQETSKNKKEENVDRHERERFSEKITFGTKVILKRHCRAVLTHTTKRKVIYYFDQSQLRQKNRPITCSRS